MYKVIIPTISTYFFCQLHDLNFICCDLNVFFNLLFIIIEIYYLLALNCFLYKLINLGVGIFAGALIYLLKRKPKIEPKIIFLWVAKLRVTLVLIKILFYFQYM